MGRRLSGVHPNPNRVTGSDGKDEWMRWGLSLIGGVAPGKSEEEWRERNKETQEESKRSGRVRSVCPRATARHTGWLLRHRVMGEERAEGGVALTLWIY